MMINYVVKYLADYGAQVGNMCQVAYDATGTSSELIRPLLGNAMGYANDRLVPP